MSALRAPATRTPLKPRPRPEAEVAEIAAEVTKRYPKTLDYLGR